MRRRVGLLAGILPALMFCWSVTVHAQDAPADAAAGSGPDVIPQVEIPTRADADERFAQDVILRAKGRDQTEKLGPQLDALDKSVREQTRLLASDDLKMVPVTRLESLDSVEHDFERSACRILISERTEQRLDAGVRREPLGSYAMKGKHEKVAVYRVLS
jgi:hypothetical protein